MTDKVCNEMSKYFSAGIWELPIVRGYPYLWMVLNLFGFVFHLQGEALKVFAYNKIFTVKEERDTSQACQAYNKDIAKEDKHHHSSFLNGIHVQINMVNQWAIFLVENNV